MAASGATGRWRHLPTVWAVVLPLLVLGPALGRGFVLSYDMVWVPDLALRANSLGLGTALPRAVPSDAVVAVLDELVPGMVLQKLVLLGSLVLAGLGVARMVETSVVGRVVAISVYVWNPFVAERLWIGHWPLLAGYAVLPWVAVAARRYRAGAVSWASLGILLPWGSLSPNAGLMTSLMMLVCGIQWRAGPGRARRNATLGVLAAAANAPWLAAGLLHAQSAGAGGTDAFALGGEGGTPPLVAALTLGGIWNTEVVPASRTGWGPWVALVGLGALAVVGARRWWRREHDRLGVPLCVAWILGLGLALLPTLLPGTVAWVVAEVPGAGLVRDSARFLALCAPLVAATVATGSEVVVDRVRGAVPRAAMALALALLPVMVMPDLAWGVGGALRPATFPASYAQARQVLATAEAARPGDVVILPFTSYRAPEWNGGRKVFAPLGRVLTPDDVTSDELVVSGRGVVGEDPRGPEVRAALAEASPAARSQALRALGIRYAAIEPGDSEQLAGRELLSTSELRLIELAGGRFVARSSGPWALATMTLAWAVWLALVVVAPLVLLRGSLRRRRHGAE